VKKDIKSIDFSFTYLFFSVHQILQILNTLYQQTRNHLIITLLYLKKLSILTKIKITLLFFHDYKKLYFGLSYMLWDVVLKSRKISPPDNLIIDPLLLITIKSIKFLQKVFARRPGTGPLHPSHPNQEEAFNQETKEVRKYTNQPASHHTQTIATRSNG
jgi:hypothetical protein